MNIQKTKGTIAKITDLSETAKEVCIKLPNNLNFIAGSFVNIFMDIDGEKVRRAYSITSSDSKQNEISLAIRLSPSGKMTPVFWKENLIGKTVELMGPLGLNTADKIKQRKIYLLGFGIGAGVVKSLADHFSLSNNPREVWIITGSRSEDQIIYRDYFDDLQKTHPNINVSYVISNPISDLYKKGYIQDHLSGLKFDDSDVYVCGQEIACNAVVAEINKMKPTNCNFFIEGFH